MYKIADAVQALKSDLERLLPTASARNIKYAIEQSARTAFPICRAPANSASADGYGERLYFESPLILANTWHLLHEFGMMS